MVDFAINDNFSFKDGKAQQTSEVTQVRQRIEAGEVVNLADQALVRQSIPKMGVMDHNLDPVFQPGRRYEALTLIANIAVNPPAARQQYVVKLLALATPIGLKVLLPAEAEYNKKDGRFRYMFSDSLPLLAKCNVDTADASLLLQMAHIFDTVGDRNTAGAYYDAIREFYSNRGIVVNSQHHVQCVGIDSIKIDFSQLVSKSTTQSVNDPRFTPLERKYLPYRFNTVGDYKQAKKYPQGIDCRPILDFEALQIKAGSTVDFMDYDDRLSLCAHGTNLQSVLSAVVHSNLQLIPGIKQIKLCGKLPETGESCGVTKLNRKYVSTVSLKYDHSTYDDVIKYAFSAANSFNLSKSYTSKIPVVVLGEGVAEGEYVYSRVHNETVYRRVNIRILAFRNKVELTFAQSELLKMQALRGDREIEGIRLYTYDDLRAATSEDGFSPDMQKLWKMAAPVVGH
ncbi:hypothetical protein [Buttiauxella ferragutiae]|uniref:hypothetical protein n=1 Tax=Buttiauxella ferragutiae TaxID=82989 RepID=UPI00352337D7